MEELHHMAWDHSPALSACHYRCSQAPICSHTPGPRENLSSSPPSTCPSCLSMPWQWGRGPAPMSPTLTPSGILGLMSCKMRRLQLTCTDGAYTRLPPPSPSVCLLAPRRILLQILSSFSGKHPLISHPFLAVPGVPRSCTPHLFSLKLHRWLGRWIGSSH